HLAGLRESRNLLSIFHDFKQAWCRWKVVVPQLMMSRLEVPLDLSGFDIDRHGRVAVKVVAWPVASIRIRAGTAHGKINNATLFIDRESESPDVISGPVLPTLETPRLHSRLTFTGNRVELPEFFARARIVSVGVTGLSSAGVQLRRDVALAGS